MCVFSTDLVRGGDKLSYEDAFYMPIINKRTKGEAKYDMYGFPMQRGSWCKKLKYGGWLKQEDIRGCVLQEAYKLEDGTQEWDDLRVPPNTGGWCTGELKTTAVQSVKHSLPKVDILGIAIDEPKRVERHSKENILLPLVEIGWTESDCRKWCEENDLLSPTYTTSLRGGCWFCHNQGVQQLRLLRRDYPNLWAILLKWDLDSPVTFHTDGHTVHDFDKRFQLEDEGILKANERFKWKDLEHPQLRIDWSEL